MKIVTRTSALPCLGVMALLSSGCSLHPAGDPRPATNDADVDAGATGGAAGIDVGDEPIGGSDVAPTDTPSGRINIFTRSYDNQRTGANLSEMTLVPALLTPDRFGRLFQLSVDDEIYAQPLYASAITVAGKQRNVLFVATTSNTVYAFDADSPGDPLWQKNFNGAGQVAQKTQVGQSCQPYLDFTATIGIVGTPVIDGATSTMYFVTRTIEGVSFVQRLHAIDITRGVERPNSPQTIAAATPGTGDGSDGGGMVAFNPRTQNQRAALGLGGGVVYVSWAAFCDTNPFHGWTMAFDGKTLARTGVANLTPNGGQGGVWMGGSGPAFDADGNVYLVTGNGSWDGQTNFGQSLVKLGARKLNRIDFFTPFNFNELNMADLDFGSAGPSFLPGTRLLAAGSKEGKVYLLDSRNLGHAAADNRQIPQVLQAVDTTPRPNATHHLHGSNVIWNGPAGLALYVWGENDFLRAYRFDARQQRFVTPAFAVSAPLLPLGMPGGMMTLSANGAGSGTGVLWVTASRAGDANRGTVPGILRAFDAENLRLLWESTNPSDDMTTLPKFNPPVVANGKVYVASFSKVISVYGLRARTPPASPTVTDGQVLSFKNPGAHLCLNATGGANAAGAPLNVTDCNGTGAQVWQASDRGGGQWELRRNGTALCVCAPDDSAGGGVRQDVCDGGAAQRFTLPMSTSMTAGGLQLRTAGAGLCVDVGRANPGGPAVRLNPCRDSDGDSQTFVPLSPHLRNYNAMLCLDAPGSALTSGLPLQLWTCGDSSGQNWQINDNLDGTVEIRRGATGLCLAVPNDNPTFGQPMLQATCDRSASQTWVNEPISGGSQLRLKGADLCVDVPLSSTTPGTNLRLWGCNQSDAQRFGF